MLTSVPGQPTVVPPRESLDPQHTWDLSAIFAGWEAWEEGFASLEQGIDAYKAHEGTLAKGPEHLLAALRDSDTLGQLAHRVWYLPGLTYDEDQRNNTINAKRQQVQLLMARWRQATAWFNPELLELALETVREWMARSTDLALYRFAIEDVFRQQAHILNEQGER